MSMLYVPAIANKTGYLSGDFYDMVNDKGEQHWAYDQMTELIAMGILTGYSETKTIYGERVQVQSAKPNQKITRAEFAAILYQALNLNGSNGDKAPFSDKIPSWAAEAVNALYKEGIIRGNPDGTFRPDRYISRAEIAAMLVNALNDRSSQTGKSFPDVSSGHWASGSIGKASAMGIINGFPNGRFYPDRNAQRAEVMVMLYQYLLNDRSQAPADKTLISRAGKVSDAMESFISDDNYDSASVLQYLTGEMEVIMSDSEAGEIIRELKEEGFLGYSVTSPGRVVRKSDRLAEVAYDSTAVLRIDEIELEVEMPIHYFLMKIGDEWYIYKENYETE
jgi:hypothetical protein